MIDIKREIRRRGRAEEKAVERLHERELQRLDGEAVEERARAHHHQRHDHQHARATGTVRETGGKPRGERQDRRYGNQRADRRHRIMVAVEKRRDQERHGGLLRRHRRDRKAKLQRARLHPSIERSRTRKLDAIVMGFLISSGARVPVDGKARRLAVRRTLTEGEWNSSARGCSCRGTGKKWSTRRSA